MRSATHIKPQTATCWPLLGGRAMLQPGALAAAATATEAITKIEKWAEKQFVGGLWLG